MLRRLLLLALCAGARGANTGAGPSLDALLGVCRTRKQGGYVFEWCHEGAVTQRHTSAPTLLQKSLQLRDSSSAY